MSADPHGYKTAAIAFAVRAGHTDAMAHAFLERLCEKGWLGQRERFGPLLTEMMQEEESHG